MTLNQKILLSLTAALLAVTVYLLTPVLIPFCIAGLLAYVSDPLVDRLERFKCSRTFATLIVWGGLLLVVLSLFLWLVPLLFHQLHSLIVKTPDLLTWLQQTALPYLEDKFKLDIDSDLLDPVSLQTALAEHWQKASSVLTVIWQTISQSSHLMLVVIIDLILIPVVLFYLLRDWDLLIEGIKRLVPRHSVDTLADLAKQSDEVLSAFLRGQLLVMLGMAIVYTVGLTMVGLQLALLVGVVAGIITFIPYMGFFTGLILATIASIIQYQSLENFIMVFIVFALGNVIETFVLTPWLVGDRIGMHPVAVLFAVLAGGQLFGFIGVLLALPVAAVLMVLIRYGRQCYLESSLYG